jgi:hypothetical protein
MGCSRHADALERYFLFRSRGQSSMAQMALLFTGFAILILLLLLVATVYYVPKALDTGHGDEDDESGGHTA